MACNSTPSTGSHHYKLSAPVAPQCIPHPVKSAAQFQGGPMISMSIPRSNLTSSFPPVFIPRNLSPSFLPSTLLTIHLALNPDSSPFLTTTQFWLECKLFWHNRTQQRKLYLVPFTRTEGQHDILNIRSLKTNHKTVSR